MASIVGPQTMAAAGSTGANTHTGVPIPADVEKSVVIFSLDVAGATPTITFKVQASLDGVNYFDIITVPNDSDTTAVSYTKTAVGLTAMFTITRFAGFVRLVTSANTNVTYSAASWVLDSE